MIKNPPALPPRVSTNTGARPSSTRSETPSVSPTEPSSTLADDSDRLERSPHSRAAYPLLAPPSTAVANLATTPLPAAQRLRTHGVDVVSYGADPKALTEVGRAIDAVAQQPGIIAAMHRDKVTLVVIPTNRRLTDLPQFADLRGQQTFDGRSWDDVRGVGGRYNLDDARIYVGIPEENLINSEADRFSDNYSVALHELAHVVHQRCLSDSDTDLIKRLYRERKQAGLPFTDSYAATNQYEYFAQATNVYFGHNEGQGVNGASWLAENDPALYRKLVELFPSTAWPEQSSAVVVEEPSPPPSRGLLDLLRNNRGPGE
jgi:hypothetical protein